MNTPSRSRRHKVHLVRYADDFIITGTSKVLLEYEVQPLVEHFLAERGLELSHEKTRITHIKDGFDFLGQTVRRFRCGKILIKPSKRSVKTFLTKIQETIDNSGDMAAGDLIERLNWRFVKSVQSQLSDDMVIGLLKAGDLLDRPGECRTQGLLHHRPTGFADGHQPMEGPLLRTALPQLAHEQAIRQHDQVDVPGLALVIT